MFITKFIRASHLSLSRAKSIQSMPYHPTSWRSIFILSSHLHLDLQSGLFCSGLPTKLCRHFSLFPSMLHSLPRASWFGHPNNIWWGIWIIKLLIVQSFALPCASSLLGPDVFLSMPFFNTLSLCSSLSMTDQVSNPYKTTGNIIVLYILSHALAHNVLYKEGALGVDGF